MANQKLKELMKDQLATISGDIQKKIAYLTSGDIFNYSYYKIDVYRQKLNFKNDDALLKAFIGNTYAPSTEVKDSYADAFMRANPEGVRAASQTSQNLTEVTDVRERISKINAKLAALRGVSMPGDYLKK